jgi:hypothetical protein
MIDILFSSWGGEIVDNRGKAPEAHTGINAYDIPEKFKQDKKIKVLIGWDCPAART